MYRPARRPTASLPLLGALLAVGLGLFGGGTPLSAQAQGVVAPPDRDLRIRDVADAPSADRIEADIRTLVGFGTRNTLSDTLSETRGIGAARRWVKAEFDRIGAECGGCLEVSYQRSLVEGDPDSRISRDTWVVNVVAILRGTVTPNRYVIMSGDIDSRASRGSDPVTDAPGANDNASGMAGVLEAARILTRRRPFGSSIVFAGLSGEEQGLWGGQHMAAVAREEGWDVAAVLNNDMIGNIQGIDGVVDNTSFRVFSQATPLPEYQPSREVRRGDTTVTVPTWNYRLYGGEVDGPSRQLARYVARIADVYFTNLDAMMIYRLDRFGRGGHHRPFNDVGYPAVRIMETHENYNRQHQDVRVEDGVAYGDVLEGVDFDYAARLTGVNAAVLASLAWAPPAPTDVAVGGAVSPSTTLAWDPVDDPRVAGYRVYWRATTAPRWEHSRFVGKVDRYTLENLVIDNYLFGVAAVGPEGDESPVAFPVRQLR